MLVSHLDSEDFLNADQARDVDFFRLHKANYLMVNMNSPLAPEIYAIQSFLLSHNMLN